MNKAPYILLGDTQFWLLVSTLRINRSDKDLRCSEKLFKKVTFEVGLEW